MAEQGSPSRFQVLLKEFVALCKQKKELERDTKAVNDRLAEIKPELRDLMIDSGIQSVRVDGKNVHLKRELFVNKLSEENGVTESALAAALREHGLAGQCKVSEGYNAASLKAWIRAKLEEYRTESDPLGERSVSLEDIGVHPDIASKLKMSESLTVNAGA
jgi:hypothetical protein